MKVNSAPSRDVSAIACAGLAWLWRRKSVEITTGLIHQLTEARDEAASAAAVQLTAHKLLIVDELGYMPLSPTGTELLFEVVSQRYERPDSRHLQPAIRGMSVFGPERHTGSPLDRLTHHVDIPEMNGESCWLKQSKSGGPKKPGPAKR